MATITLIEPYRAMWGKLIHGSDWWTFRRGRKLFTGHKHKGRDIINHPITAEERKTTDRICEANRRYHRLDHNSEEYKQLYKDWWQQRNEPGGCVSPRGLFVRRV